MRMHKLIMGMLLGILSMALAQNVAWAGTDGEAKGELSKSGSEAKNDTSTPTNQEAEQARALAVINHAAKTEEEFLRRVKTVWDKPEASMTEVAETITGVSVHLFIHPTEIWSGKGYALDLEYTLYPNAPYDGVFATNWPETAKRTNFYRLPEEGFIRDELIFSFYGQTRMDNPQRNLCITAGKTREILGEPTKMFLKGLSFESGNFVYEYINGKRKMILNFDGASSNPRPDKPLEVLLEEIKDSCLQRIHYIYLY